MSAFTIKDVPTRCLWVALVFCTVYNSYRYPLQINSATTSPTYSDTPPAFQIAKFLVIALLCLISVFYIPSRSLPYKKWLVAGYLAYLALFPISKALLSDAESRTQYLEIAFWPLAALILALAAGPISTASLNRYFRFVFAYALLSTVIEVSLFFVLGRLPALAYKGTFSVRFGGFLDDPNGFPALLYMLIGWAYYKYSGWKCVFAEAALLLCLVSTQSLTALAYLVLFAIFFIGYHILRGPRPVLVVALCAMAVSALIPEWPQIAKFVSVVMELRSGSINVHLAQNTAPVGSTVIERFFGGEGYVPYESWWIGSLHNFGLPWYLLSLTAVLIPVWFCISAFRRARGDQEKAVLCAITMLAVYFLVGNSNLPFFTVFPVNFAFFSLSNLVLFGRITAVNSHFEEAAKISRSTGWRIPLQPVSSPNNHAE